MISKESLEKFKKLYKQEFNEELTEDEALRRATRLLNFYRAIYAPFLLEGYQNNEKIADNQQLKEKGYE